MVLLTRARDVTADVFDDLVAEKAAAHPADHQEVDEGDARAIEDAVLRPTEAARTVADRHLDHAVPAHREECRDEAMEAAVEHQSAQALAPEGVEGAAARVADAVRHPRRDPTHHTIAGGAIHSPAGG